MEIPQPHETAAREAGERRKQVDAYQDLWRAVLDRAVQDLQYRKDKEGRDDLKRHEREKMQKIEEFPPDEFLKSSWFEEICDYLGLDPNMFRRFLKERGVI